MCRHEHELCQRDLRGLSKEEVNKHYFEFIRNATKEEREANGWNNRNTRGLYKCRICGDISFYRNSHFKDRLKVCRNNCNGVKRGNSGRTIIIGFNDLATTHPEYIKYFVNIEDVYTHSYASIDEVDLICPDCGYIKRMSIVQLIGYGFSCDFCSDGISYPNKVMAMVVEALGLNYKLEYVVEGYKYRFDIYLTDYNKIIENDGSQHYAYLDENLQNKKIWNNETGMEIHYTDLGKESVLMNSGIDLIVIDCSESNIDYIRNNIEKHSFFKQFDLSNIDWQEVDIEAQKSVKIEVCKYWKEQKEINKDLIILDIAKEFKIDKTTVRYYLKWGNENGLCTYNVEEEIKNKNERLSKFIYLIKPDGTKWFNEAMSQRAMWKATGISDTVLRRHKNKKQPLRYDSRAKYDSKYIGSYVVDADEWDSQHN